MGWLETGGGGRVSLLTFYIQILWFLSGFGALGGHGVGVLLVLLGVFSSGAGSTLLELLP